MTFGIKCTAPTIHLEGQIGVCVGTIDFTVNAPSNQLFSSLSDTSIDICEVWECFWAVAMFWARNYEMNEALESNEASYSLEAIQSTIIGLRQQWR